MQGRTKLIGARSIAPMMPVRLSKKGIAFASSHARKRKKAEQANQ